VGPCIDLQRSEPAFPWDALPSGAALAYCSFGTQSLRSREAPALLRTIGEVFARRDDFFLVMACPESHRAALPATVTRAAGRVLVVTEAPQLALLRRARLAITHAGFNSVKECAALGVPMIALPLLHDQPRNAALVHYHHAGRALHPPRLSAAALDQAVTEVAGSAAIRESCGRLERLFAAEPSTDAALAYLDGLLGPRAA
jgi:UDP:flavonoid glycosyltransferase YjiC (YdhE family)